MSAALEGEMPDSTLPASLEHHRIINVKQMADALGFSVRHLRRLYSGGKIPKPIAINGHKLGWPAATLVALTSPAGIKEAA